MHQLNRIESIEPSTSYTSVDKQRNSAKQSSTVYGDGYVQSSTGRAQPGLSRAPPLLAEVEELHVTRERAAEAVAILAHAGHSASLHTLLTPTN